MHGPVISAAGEPNSDEVEDAGQIRAAIYVRISRDSEGDGLGVARQEVDCRARCEDRRWRVVDLYVDNDVSAYSGATRPNYDRMMADVEAGLIDVIIAWHPDRLHRRPAELEDFIGTVERLDVDVQTVTAGRIDLSTPSGRMSARMLGTVARYESEHRSERLCRKALELAELGKVGGGGRRPFGYSPDRRSIVEGEAEVIREAARRVLLGQSLSAIAEDWNGRPVHTVTGAKWSTTAIKTFLIAPRITGLREHHGVVVADAEWPAIVDRHTWEQVRSILTDPSRGIRHRSRKYVLTGLLRCGKCGHPLVGTPRTPRRGTGKRGSYVSIHGETQRAYGCVKANGGCGGVYIIAEPLEAFVAEVLLRRLRGRGLDRARQRLAKKAGRTTLLLERISEGNTALAELGREFARKEIARTALLAAQQVVQEQMDAARHELATEARTQALNTVSDLSEEWAELDEDRRRAILDAVLDSVAINPATGIRNRFDPDRVQPKWLA